MKDFKLIAIRPLAGCDKKFTKILSEGIPYLSYNEYDFSKYTDQSRIIKQIENVTPDLFSLKNNFKNEGSVDIISAVGTTVWSSKLTAKDNIKIDLPQLNQGVYLILLTENGKKHYKKMIINK